MRYVVLLIVSLFLFFQSFGAQKQDSSAVEINLPYIVLKGLPVTVEFNVTDTLTYKTLQVKIGDEHHILPLNNGEANIEHAFKKNTTIQIQNISPQSRPIKPIPLWMSILPPLIAILMALVFREVITALITGLLVGTSIIHVYGTGDLMTGIGKGLLSIIDTYVIESLLDPGHLSIIVFSMMIGAMVNVITRNGGMKGVVNLLSKKAKTAKSGQFITWLLGIAIFFDDYANTLVVGNTMRPVTDNLKISRQKLAYIVDSTAAPIAAVAFVTTWIGAELSYIESGISTLGLNLSPYNVFLSSLAYSFYPIFALIFILMLIRRGVDFGPMYRVEKKVRVEGVNKEDNNAGFSNQLNELEIDEKVKGRWFNAAIPVLIVVFGTFGALLYTGWDADLVKNSDLSFTKKLSTIIGNSDSYKALLWSSLVATMVAVLLSISQRLLTLQESIDSIINGFRTMLTAIIILVLAWSIALVTEHLHTADFISRIIIQTSLSPVFVPVITFILAALVAFSTGSSWGTMAILYPLILPASWLITKEFGYEHAHSLNIFYNVVASVLAGSVLGDHCSPISDTTILSSLASSCPHIEHVRTQLPYALTVGGVAAFLGVFPASLGVPAYITFPVGLTVLYLIVRVFGKKTS